MIRCPHCAHPLTAAEVAALIASEGKSPAAVELGRRGGLAPREQPRGFAAMSAERRAEIAREAARRRWDKGKEEGA